MIKEASETAKDVKIGQMDDRERKQAEVVGTLTDNHNTERNNEKKEWVKASFWVPTNTPEADKKGLAAEMPSKKLKCPIFEKNEKGEEKKHSIKIKELVSLKFKCEEVKVVSGGAGGGAVDGKGTKMKK